MSVSREQFDQCCGAIERQCRRLRDEGYDDQAVIGALSNVFTERLGKYSATLEDGVEFLKESINLARDCAGGAMLQAAREGKGGAGGA